MRYTAITTPEAEASVTDAFVFIAAQAPSAERWLRELSAAIESLELFPGRCAVARESRETGSDLRQLIYKSHRIVFRIEPEIVRVLHVRHVAQRPVGETDLTLPCTFHTAHLTPLVAPDNFPTGCCG